MQHTTTTTTRNNSQRQDFPPLKSYIPSQTCRTSLNAILRGGFASIRRPRFRPGRAFLPFHNGVGGEAVQDLLFEFVLKANARMPMMLAFLRWGGAR